MLAMLAGNDDGCNSTHLESITLGKVTVKQECFLNIPKVLSFIAPKIVQ